MRTQAQTGIAFLRLSRLLGGTPPIAPPDATTFLVSETSVGRVGRKRAYVDRVNQGFTRAGQTCFETNSSSTVRTMFALYTLLIAGGIVLFVIVGLTQQ